jgi:hypothetical protein
MAVIGLFNLLGGNFPPDLVLLKHVKRPEYYGIQFPSTTDETKRKTYICVWSDTKLVDISQLNFVKPEEAINFMPHEIMFNDALDLAKRHNQAFGDVAGIVLMDDYRDGINVNEATLFHID